MLSDSLGQIWEQVAAMPVRHEVLLRVRAQWVLASASELAGCSPRESWSQEQLWSGRM